MLQREAFFHGSKVGKDVSNSADCADQTKVIGIQLFAKIGDVDGDGSVVAQTVAIPNLLIQLLIQQQCVGMIDQIDQQRVLNGRHINDSSVPDDIAVDCVNGEGLELPQTVCLWHSVGVPY